jgi:GDSL-like lipase/acylhydrolase family protein/uncharacterized protein DUF5648
MWLTDGPKVRVWLHGYLYLASLLLLTVPGWAMDEKPSNLPPAQSEMSDQPSAPAAEPAQQIDQPESQAPPPGLTVHDQQDTAGQPNGNSATESEIGQPEQEVLTRGLEQGPSALIVSIGDSYASGEGVPNEPQRFDSFGMIKMGPKWSDARCHRSNNAGPEMAAALLRAKLNRNVEFISVACTGAKISVGILKPYDPNNGSNYLTPQIDEVARIASGRRIDALIMSAGGNDIGFTDIIKNCIKQDIAAHLDPARSTKLCWEYAQTRNRVADGLNQLPSKYAELAARLKGLNVYKVFITEYPDPTRGENGDFCGKGGNSRLLGMDWQTARWAHEQVLLPLNQKIKEAAEAHGWIYVDGLVSDFRTHGYCAGDRRWFRTEEDARNIQGPYDFTILQGLQAPGIIDLLAGPENYLANSIAKAGFVFSSGSVHPNVEGHKAYANRLVNKFPSTPLMVKQSPQAIEVCKDQRVHVAAVDSMTGQAVPGKVLLDGQYFTELHQEKPYVFHLRRIVQSQNLALSSSARTSLRMIPPSLTVQAPGYPVMGASPYVDGGFRIPQVFVAYETNVPFLDQLQIAQLGSANFSLTRTMEESKLLEYLSQPVTVTIHTAEDPQFSKLHRAEVYAGSILMGETNKPIVTTMDKVLNRPLPQRPPSIKGPRKCPKGLPGYKEEVIGCERTEYLPEPEPINIDRDLTYFLGWFVLPFDCFAEKNLIGIPARNAPTQVPPLAAPFAPEGATAGIQVYRWYNPPNEWHFYTNNAAERPAGWQSENVAFHLFPDGTPGTVTLFRLWRSDGGHFYTVTGPELDAVMRNGWKVEGPLGNIAPQQMPGTVALHRFYKPANGRHFYTTQRDEGERGGFKYEGVAGYVPTGHVNAPVPAMPPPPPVSAPQAPSAPPAAPTAAERMRK